MHNSIFKNLLGSYCLRTGHLAWAYRRLCNPHGLEWAAYLRRWGGLNQMGKDCAIFPDVLITDPRFVQMGNNVRMSGCSLFCHEGSVNMINQAYGAKLDRFRKIDIGSNVFIGHRAIILPGVTIGDNVLIGAGAVVCRDVPSNSVMVGNPAQKVETLDAYVEHLAVENEHMPWRDLVLERTGVFDRALETKIDNARMEFFYDGGR